MAATPGRGGGGGCVAGRWRELVQEWRQGGEELLKAGGKQKRPKVALLPPLRLPPMGAGPRSRGRLLAWVAEGARSFEMAGVGVPGVDSASGGLAAVDVIGRYPLWPGSSSGAPQQLAARLAGIDVIYSTLRAARARHLLDQRRGAQTGLRLQARLTQLTCPPSCAHLWVDALLFFPLDHF